MFYISANGMNGPPPAGPPPATPGFWGTFPDPALERRFRRAYARADALALRLVVGLAVAGSVFFVTNDLSWPAELPALLGVRGGFVAGSAVVLWRLRQRIEANRLARLAAAWCGLFVAQNLATQLMRPPGHLGHAVMTVCVVMLTYGVMPLPARLQAALGGGHAAVYLLVAAWVRPAGDPALLRALGLGLAAGNALGFLAARQLQVRARDLFVALERQAELTATLEKALAEVRTLRGLVRICAWCKHIHADGEWHRLEKYVAANSHAEFTHGICPACLAEQIKPAAAPASPG